MIWPFNKRPESQPAEVTPEALRGFLRAGGVVRLAEWVGLDDATRAALEAAGTAVAAERVTLLAGLLMGSAEAVEEVSRVVDGGASAEEARLSARLTASLKGVPRG